MSRYNLENVYKLLEHWVVNKSFTKTVYDHNVLTPLMTVDCMINSIPDIENKKSFFVWFNMEIVFVLIHKYGVSPDQIRFEGYCPDKHKIMESIGVVEYIPPSCVAEKEEIDLKFDVILGNPPYQGKEELHQQFFNLGVDMLNEGGSICFLQPATPYFNKKSSKRKHESKMMKLLQQYNTEVKFIPSQIFSNADIGTDLAITHLKKEISGNNIDFVEYSNGDSYTNTPLDCINKMSIDPDTYQSIKEKYEHYIKHHGSLLDKVSKNPTVFKASLPKIRGTAASNSRDFYTIVSLDQTSKINSEFGIVVDEESQINNVYDYLKSYVARMGLALQKFSINNENREFLYIPLVKFNRTYTDDELFSMMNLNNQEIATIKTVISDYYNRG